MKSAEQSADEILQLMRERGGSSYFGEPVTQLEHALQAAWLATQAQRAPTLVAAALLHDIGHLLHAEPEDVAERGIDTRHEEAGYLWLLERFGTRVADPVRAHVPAKRYLCRTDPGYYASLSPASVQSLNLQGGIFSSEEAREFEREAWYREAVQLRYWDDAAKDPDLPVPGLEHYRDLLARLLDEPASR